MGKNQQKPLTVARKVEYLGAACEQKVADGTPLVVISVRLNPTQSHTPTDIAFTREQIFRLRTELDSLVENNDCLQLPEEDEQKLADELVDAFKAIDTNQVKVKGKGKNGI